jgi:hypothetical protein
MLPLHPDAMLKIVTDMRIERTRPTRTGRKRS